MRGEGSSAVELQEAKPTFTTGAMAAPELGLVLSRHVQTDTGITPAGTVDSTAVPHEEVVVLIDSVLQTEHTFGDARAWVEAGQQNGGAQ